LLRYLSGTGTVKQFKEAMNLSLRRLWIEGLDLGLRTGGYDKDFPFGVVTTEDERWLSSAFREERKYFDRFLDQAVAGTSRVPPFQRIDHYVSSVSSAYDVGRLGTTPINVKIDWLLQSGNPCPGCIYIWKHSPYSKYNLPATPKSGQTPCLHNCYCKLRISQMDQDRWVKWARRLKSRNELAKDLRKIKRRKK
jgi:hypothetical protein